MADNNKIREEVKALTERLEMGLQDLYTSEKYAAYLSVLSRFHNYSTRNTMLIYFQMSNATQVAGFNKWKKEFDRHVTKGQKGIRIFAPSPYTVKKEMEQLDPDTQAPILDNDGNAVVEEVEIKVPAFKPVSVFDVSQTDGKPLPTLAGDIVGDVRQYDALLDALKDVSVMPIGFENLGVETDGLCNYTDRTISIREGMSESQTISAVLHEMTHAELHDYNIELEQREQDSDAEAVGQGGAENKPLSRSRRAEEVEAESVSYVVCQHYGIETGGNSFGYVASWSKGKELDELKASLDIIRKTAASMIERIDSRFAEICAERGVDLTPEQDAPEQPATMDIAQELNQENNLDAKENAADSQEPDAAMPATGDSQYYITEQQREQAERTAAKWEARAEAFYAGGDDWGYDTADYCKTPEDAEKAEKRAASIHHAIDSLVRGTGTWSDVQVIQEAVSNRDELDAQVVANRDIHAATQEQEPKEQTVPASPEFEKNNQTENADASAGYATPQITPEQVQAEPEKGPDNLLPDPGIGLSERNIYGYIEPDMLPMLQQRALELFDQDLTVYLLYRDGTEAMAFERSDIEHHDGIFGIVGEDWKASRDYEILTSDTKVSEAEKETGGTYDIYQLKDGDEARDYRFASLENLEARGLKVNRDNYNLVYSAPLTGADTVDSIYEKFNIDRPADFTGHSLSMSDVVVIWQEDSATAHYIDFSNFRELPDFFKDNMQPEIASTEVERWENDHSAAIAISTPPPENEPTVSELEAQVQAGQQISLLDLARATQNEQSKAKERPPQVSKQKAEKPSILARLQEAKREAAQGNENQKSDPKHNNLEV